MKRDAIVKARAEATEFLALSEQLLTESWDAGGDDRGRILVGTKLSGSVRRSSMELTRALAEMRKS